MSIESSPVGDSQSNGMVERGIQTWEGQVRTLKDALEHRIQREIDPGHPIMTWIEHATSLIRRCSIGTDGQTALQRVKGRPSRTQFVEFGEKVWFVPLVKTGSALDPVVKVGIYLKILDRSDACIVLISEGPVQNLLNCLI